jgi:hypothetical protein
MTWEVRLLNFLKEVPAWLILTAVFFSVLALYYISHDAFLQRLVDAVLGGLMGVLIGKRLSNSPTTVTADTINTVDVVSSDAPLEGEQAPEELEPEDTRGE